MTEEKPKRVVGRPFVKGQVTNPNGRPPIIKPELQKIIDSNRNAVKALILTEVEPQMQEWIRAIIASGVEQGDVLRFKMLMEIALGKMVEEAPEFPINDEEKLLILEFRRRKKEQLEPIARSINVAGPDTGSESIQS